MKEDPIFSELFDENGFKVPDIDHDKKLLHLIFPHKAGIDEIEQLLDTHKIDKKEILADLDFIQLTTYFGHTYETKVDWASITTEYSAAWMVLLEECLKGIYIKITQKKRPSNKEIGEFFKDKAPIFYKFGRINEKRRLRNVISHPKFHYEGQNEDIRVYYEHKTKKRKVRKDVLISELSHTQLLITDYLDMLSGVLYEPINVLRKKMDRCLIIQSTIDVFLGNSLDFETPSLYLHLIESFCDLFDIPKELSQFFSSNYFEYKDFKDTEIDAVFTRPELTILKDHFEASYFIDFIYLMLMQMLGYGKEEGTSKGEVANAINPNSAFNSKIRELLSYTLSQGIMKGLDLFILEGIYLYRISTQDNIQAKIRNTNNLIKMVNKFSKYQKTIESDFRGYMKVSPDSENSAKNNLIDEFLLEFDFSLHFVSVTHIMDFVQNVREWNQIDIKQGLEILKVFNQQLGTKEFNMTRIGFTNKQQTNFQNNMSKMIIHIQSYI